MRLIKPHYTAEVERRSRDPVVEYARDDADRDRLLIT